MKNFGSMFVAFAMTMFVAVSAQAQRVINTVNTRDAQACGTHLVSNPLDTLVNVFNIQNGTITRSVYLKDGDINKMVAFNDTVLFEKKVVETINMKEVRQLDTLSVESRVVEQLYSDQPRDVVYYNSNAVAAYRTALNGDDSDKGAGKIVDKAANKYGWSVQGHIGYSVADGLNGVVGGLGLSYDRRYWGIYLNGEFGQSKYSLKAVNADKPYSTYRAETALLIRPIQLDKFDQHRLFILGGIGFEHYETDSQPYIDAEGNVGLLSSTGNYLYATAGAAYEYRFFATGNCLGARLQWRDTKATVQNENYQNFGSVVFSLYYKFGFNRNKVNTK